MTRWSGRKSFDRKVIVTAWAFTPQNLGALGGEIKIFVRLSHDILEKNDLAA